MTLDVFVFEGFLGYPFGVVRRWMPRGAASPDSLGARLAFGCVSPAQAANFVLPVLAEFPNVVTHYLPQTHHGTATRQIAAMLRRNINSAASIAVIGFSYGGDAAHRTAHQLAKLFPNCETLRFVMTIDPVAKWRINTTPADVGRYGFRRASGVQYWLNAYQRCDGGSFRIPHTPLAKRIWGDAVADCDEEQVLTAADFRPEVIGSASLAPIVAARASRLATEAHLWIPGHHTIQEMLRQQIAKTMLPKTEVF